MKFYNSNYFNSLEENSALKKEWEQFLFSYPHVVDCQVIGGNVKNTFEFMERNEDLESEGKEYSICLMPSVGIYGLYSFETEAEMFIFLSQIIEIYKTDKIAIEMPSIDFSHFLQGREYNSPLPEKRDFPTVIMFGDSPIVEDYRPPIAIFNAEDLKNKIAPENYSTFPLVAFGTKDQMELFFEAVKEKIEHYENQLKLPFYTYWKKMELNWY